MTLSGFKFKFELAQILGKKLFPIQFLIDFKLGLKGALKDGYVFKRQYFKFRNPLSHLNID